MPDTKNVAVSAKDVNADALSATLQAKLEIQAPAAVDNTAALKALEALVASDATPDSRNAAAKALAHCDYATSLTVMAKVRSLMEDKKAAAVGYNAVAALASAKARVFEPSLVATIPAVLAGVADKLTPVRTAADVAILALAELVSTFSVGAVLPLLMPELLAYKWQTKLAALAFVFRLAERCPAPLAPLPPRARPAAHGGALGHEAAGGGVGGDDAVDGVRRGAEPRRAAVRAGAGELHGEPERGRGVRAQDRRDDLRAGCRGPHARGAGPRPRARPQGGQHRRDSQVRGDHRQHVQARRARLGGDRVPARAAPQGRGGVGERVGPRVPRRGTPRPRDPPAHRARGQGLPRRAVRRARRDAQARPDRPTGGVPQGQGRRPLGPRLRERARRNRRQRPRRGPRVARAVPRPGGDAGADRGGGGRRGQGAAARREPDRG